jgi:acetyl-CoA carboxylase beta subunit
MSTKFVSYFCDNCNSLLNTFNMVSLSVPCSKCHKTNRMSNDNRIIATMTYGSALKTLQPNEMVALSKLQTTQRIEKECKNCKNPIMALVMDENYNCNYICIKCHFIHS